MNIRSIVCSSIFSFQKLNDLCMNPISVGNFRVFDNYLAQDKAVIKIRNMVM